MNLETIKQFFNNEEDKQFLLNHPIFDKINAFTYSSWFYLILTILTCVFWQFNLIAVSIVFFIILISIMLVVQKDVTPLVPLILFTMISIKDTSDVGYLLKFLWILVPIIAAIIFHIAYYTRKPFKMGRMFYAHIAIFISCLVGGLFAPESKLIHNVVNSVLVTGIPLLVYVIYQNYTAPRKDKDYTLISAKFLLFLGVTIVVQLLLWRRANPKAFAMDIVPHLGWSISNTIATVLLFPIPMGFYLFVKEKRFKYGYLILGCLSALGIVITTSRGCFIFGILVLALSFIVTIFNIKGQDRIKYLFFLGIVIVIGLTTLYVASNQIARIVGTIFHDKFKSNGRIELYQEALQVFAKYPVLGGGLSYAGIDTRNIDEAHFYMFHCTIFQILGSLGIVGILAYGYYYFVKIEALLENYKPFNIFVIIAYIGFEGYSLINTGTFRGILFGIILVMLTLAIEHNSQLPQKISLKNVSFKHNN